MPAESKNEAPIIRFGTFEIDVRAGELRRNGTRVKLQEQPFQVLIALLDRPGEVVTRDELQKKLWPADTFVDFDHSLNAAIRRVREALGDSAENPRFVETLARRGYRFIGPVASTAVETEPPQTEGDSSRRHIWPWAALAVVLLVVGTIIGFRFGAGSSAFSPPMQRRLTANPEDARLTGAAISPDGRYLAFSDVNGCYFRQIDTGETHSIAVPAGSNPRIASWFPDGVHLLAIWAANPTEPASLWTISILGGPPRKLASQGQWPVVSPDGSQILFVENSESGWMTPQGSRAVWLMQADGEKAHKIVEGREGEFGSSFGPPSWAPDGRRIALVRSQYHPGNIDSDSQIEIFDLATRQTHVALRTSRLIGAVVWTKDSRLIYSAVEARPMPTDSNLWAIHLDDRANRAVGEATRLTTESGFVSSITSSADGSRLAVLRETLQPDVYISNVEKDGRALSPPKRLTLDERDDYPFAWAPDDKSVLFVSNRDGTYHIFKQAFDSPDAELLIGGDEQVFVPRLSPDGSQFLYFITPKMGSASNHVRLMRVPVAGGPPQLVTEGEGINNQQCARAPATLCLFSTLDQRRERFFTFDPMKGPTGELSQLAIESVEYSNYNWSLSPDGQTLLTSIKRHTATDSGQEVAVALKDFTTRTIAVPNWAFISSLDWAADGKSIWASAHNPNNASALLSIDLDGHIRPMLHEDKMLLGWAIPSSDGRMLAFWKATGNANAWLVEKF